MAINRLNPDYPDAGTVQLIPSSVAVGSGSSTVNGNGTVSFSGASSVSLNDVFSATYKNYRILITINDNASNPSDLQFRLRVSSSDASGANYRNHNIFINSSGATGNYGSGTAGTFFYAGVQIAQTQSRGAIEVYSPFETQHTGLVGLGGGGDLTVVAGGRHTLDTSYTGFTIFADAGNIDGSVSVYGYRN